MSYYYEDTEYADYGNHGDEYNEYESYSDYAEPNHCKYEERYHNNADREDAPGESEHGYREPEYKILTPRQRNRRKLGSRR
jgi:hypothetical protein